MRKFTSVFLSLATAVTLSGVIMPMTASALTVAELQAQITALQTQLTALQGGTTGTGYTFSADLKMGSTGTDVKNLQIVLNKDTATQIAQGTDAGAPGYETSYFGIRTKAAVIKFQDKYTSEVLTPVGLTSGTGYVGSMSRAKLNALYGGTPTTPATPGTTPTTPTTPAGTGLTVEAGVQPSATLAPDNASRIPFTVVKFTASADGDVTVSSLTVERTGLANDAVFSGLILLDENLQQLGLEKTLNSVHQVILNEPFVVKAGQTRTMTIAGNRADTATHAGEIAYLALVAVNTSATVNGTLPITGSGQTINETLAIGSVTMAKGPLDPATTATKEIGTTGYTFSSVKITAGSNEKVRLLSIRWNQAGSAAQSDFANLKTYVDGTAYATAISADGKYYTTTFDGGIVIDKGFSKEVSIKGDIVGGSARTMIFDIYKRTDIYLKGETYNYGITPANGTETGDGKFTASNPWYNAYAVTVSAGTLNVAKSTSVSAQNIAINLADQPLGGFEIEAKGEPVSVGSMVFGLTITDGTGGPTTPAVGTDIDNVSLYDENGKVVAGPVDATGAYAQGTVTFTDSVTFPVGKHVYQLKGKLYVNGTTSGFGNNDTIQASTTPSTSATAADNFTTVTGQSTGVTIYPTPYSVVAASTMTIKAGSLAVSVSSVPLAQTVIAGTSQYLFANYVLDAGASGEDVSLNSLAVSYNVEGGLAANAQMLTSCNMYVDGATITTGSNIKSPTAAASSTTFTFDAPLTIPKSTSKTIALKCDIAGSADGQIWRWGYNATDNDISPMGKVSGQDITETETTGIGQAMTAATGGTMTAVNNSTAGYTIVSAGTTGVTLLKLKFSATNEDIDLQKVAFELAGNASNTPQDLAGQKIYLYDEANPTVSVATAEFTTTDYATSTLIAAGAFRIPSGGTKSMLVKGDISGISGTVGPITHSGDLLRVAYDGNSVGLANGTYGKGVSSGGNVTGSATDITPTGVRIFKAYPELTKVDLSTSERTLQTGSEANLYKFKITAKGGDVYLYKTSFSVSSSTQTATTTNFGLYAYTDSAYSLADTSYSTNGLLNYGHAIGSMGIGRSAANSPTACPTWTANVSATTTPIVEIWPKDTDAATTTYKIPYVAGDTTASTRWFAFRSDVCNVETTASLTENISVKLLGDAAFPLSLGNSLMLAASSTSLTAIDTVVDNDFIWSPNSTSTSLTLYDLDFTNGYGLTGLPTDNMAQEILTSAN